MTGSTVTVGFEISLSAESRQLAARTFANSTLGASAVVIGTGDEDIGGVPTIFFDYRLDGGGEGRVYADCE